MNLAVTYLGLPLHSPIIVGSAPFCGDLEVCRALEGAGAGALVMGSLFAEQLGPRQPSRSRRSQTTAAPAETDAFLRPGKYQFSPGEYLRQIARLKKCLQIPVVASLNGRASGTWADCARQFEDAGADAIELNPYQVVTDAVRSSDQVELEILQMLRSVTAAVDLPVAVKLSPFHTSLPQFATALDLSGAAGLVVFNRFYQSDFDIELVGPLPRLRLSDSSELLLRLRWLAILSPQMRGSLACSGGVHHAHDVVKAILAGAHGVQVVSALLKNGPGFPASLLRGIEAWMTAHGHSSLDDFRGALNLRRCPDPAEHERAGYLRVLQDWRD